MNSGRAEVDHFVIGDGALACVVEWSRSPDREPYGLLVAEPGRMARREATLLWHPEHRLRRTMLTVIVDGVRCSPQYQSTTVEWGEEGDVLIRWRAGTADVEERLRTIHQVLRREVTVHAPAARRVRVEAALYGNPLLFDELEASGSHLAALGLTSIALYGGEPFERFITATPTRDERDVYSWRFEYISPCGRDALRAHSSPLHRRAGEQARPGLPLPEGELPHTNRSIVAATHESRQLAISRHSMRAAVSRDGRFNASLFQYEFEWGLDAAMVSSAASLAGDHTLAAEILTNILERLSNEAGMIAEASRFRGGELSELNGNGAVLDALWRYWLVSRDDDLPRRFWERIVAIAEYPLRDEFSHESGLLRTRRDFWERYPWQGVGEGFELGHQVFCAVGLASAAQLAAIVGDDERAERWRYASERIRRAMIEHPSHSLVVDGRFIRRRLVDGSVETSLVADTAWDREEYAPYLPANHDATPRACEPDVTEVLPIVYGLVDPAADVALATLDAVDALWSPRGGYTRYNIASDPDSPGPWPFATAMVAAAELRSGRGDRAKRATDWLLHTAGAGGSWLEYYGERASPPHPPIGIIVWGWAQYIILALEHMAGIRIERDHVLIAPRAAGIAHTLVIGDHTVRLDIRGLATATLNKEPTPSPVTISLPLSRDYDVLYV